MKRKTAAWLWAGFFVILFLLSLDFWRWEDEIRLGWLGFPDWIWWFVGLQVVLVGGLWVFVRRFWGNEEE